MKTILTILTMTMSLLLTAQNLYFPPSTGNWDTISPNSLNWCVNELDSLQQFLEDKNTKGFIILKDGKIVTEWYFDGFAQDSLWYWASAGKTLTATLVGIAEQENHLNFTDATSQYLGKWTSCSTVDEQQITILNQLTMTSGLDDSEFDCTDSLCFTCLTSVNSRWAYHNSPYTLLTNVVESATGQGYNLYLQQKINSKIGSSIFYLPFGNNRLAVSNTRDIARFGLLTLAKGNWNGTQVYDSTYYHLMTNTSQNLNPAYGYLWWLNGKSQYMLPSSQITFNGKLVPNAPDDMFAALGKNDQKIYVVPSENMVVIRIGNSSGTSLFALSTFDNELWGKINDLSCTNSTSNFAKAEKNVTIYPNPTAGILNIKTAELIENIEVYSTFGQLLLNRKVVDNQLDISNLESGIYYLKITLENGKVITERLIKEN
ncbi:MAG: serine hydrolase [Saprospiraceae bacterium]